MSSDLEALLDVLVADVQISQGRPAEWVLSTTPTYRPGRTQKRRKAPAWSAEEITYLREHCHHASPEEIGLALGRSTNSVHIQRTRLGTGSPRNAPGYMSGNKIARLLGVDSHKPTAWFDRGELESEPFPYEGTIKKRRVKIATLMRFLVRPRSWVLFDARRIVNPHIRSLVLRAQARWGDEWWSMRQAADHLGCTPSDVQRQIKMGRIEGIHMPLDRKRQQGWAFWFVRRSQVETLRIPRRDEPRGGWSERADAYLVCARREGLAIQDIAARMKWSDRRVQYRLRMLRAEGVELPLSERGRPRKRG